MGDREVDPAAYALDALTEQERAEFQRRMASEPALAEETRAAAEVAAGLGLAASEAPPASLKRNVLAAIKAVPQEEPRGSAQETPQELAAALRTGTTATTRTAQRPRPLDRRWLTGLALAASGLLLAAAALGGVLVSEQREQAELRDQIAALEGDTEQMRRLLQAPDVRSATVETPEGNDVVLVYSAGQGLMTVSGEDLPAAPTGHAYELWLISGSGAEPAGFLPAGDVAVIDGPMEGVTHLGITVEPEQGSEQPTTEPIVLQQL